MAIDRDGDGPPLRRDDARIPKPADGLRASPFTEDVFDDEYYGRRPRRTGGISFGVIVGVVFVAAVVAAAGWYILAERSGITPVAGQGEVVHADPTPYKIKPDDPGGLQVANQDKLIYDDRMAKGPAPKHAENLLPAPEEPRAPPVKAVPEPKPAAPEVKVASEAKPEPKVETKPEPGTTPPAADPMADLMAKVEGMKKPEKEQTPPDAKAPTSVASIPTAPAASPTASPTASPATSPMLLVPAAETPGAPAPVAAPPSAAVADAAPAVPMTPPSPPSALAPVAAPSGTPGAVYVQLASARSEDGAMSEWKRISTKNADLLTGLSPAVAQAEVPDKGTFFRLRAGPISDRAAAQELCGNLIARGLTCLIVRP